MSRLSGMEKFSHLEDKIFLTVENVRKIREEKDRLEREIAALRQEIAGLLFEKESLEAKMTDLVSERDAIKLKVESMLEAVTIIEPEVARILRG
jgi:uncharacterized coiled-coil DUF342 family protein